MDASAPQPRRRAAAVGPRPRPWPRAAPRVLELALPATADEDTALLAGLFERPARVDPRFLYDGQGCALFGAITRLEEYDLPRREAAILEEYAGVIGATLPGDAQWIDLGCGDGMKSTPWLARVRARRYIGVDAAPDCLRQTLVQLRQASGRDCVGVLADLARPWSLQALLAECPNSPPVFFYAGSSIGNFAPTEAIGLLARVRAHCGSGGALLIGVDLVKPRSAMEAAYNDALGITAAFNRNVLRVANRRLGADFNPHQFAHFARWNPRAGRIEMHLIARRAQLISFTRFGHAQRHFETGESIVTEHCHKYPLDGFARLLSLAGFSRHRAFCDAAGGYAVFLARP